MNEPSESDAPRRTPSEPPTAEPDMRAVVQDRYGGVDALRQARLPRPVATDTEVLVRVHAAGLDRGTWHLMTGKPYLMRIAGLGFRGPKDPVPGRDLAGTVTAVGADVTRFAVGDEVYGVGRGSFAEYAVAREDKLARKPASLSFEQAAVVPISAATALQALTDHRPPRAGPDGAGHRRLRRRRQLRRPARQGARAPRSPGVAQHRQARPGALARRRPRHRLHPRRLRRRSRATT